MNGGRTIARATVRVDLGKIEDNARRVVEALPGIDVVGVTKVTCGSPEVGRAMLAGGCVALGESRLENAARLRGAGLEAPLWLLRAPTPELADDVVRLADVSLESELATVEALDRACVRAGERHGVVAMVDVGDLREGMMPAELPAFVEGAVGLAGIDVIGVGTSLTCFGAIVPSEENLGELVALAEEAERRVGRRLLVSGGMSSSIELAVADGMPRRVDNLRIGETIVLGVSTVTREPVLGLHADAVIVAAPVVECRVKPSAPTGTCAQDAFGGCPTFEDRGERRRAICAIGRQDAPPEGLRPIDPRVEVLGASSDHLILDVEDLPRPPEIGEGVEFVPNYAATLALFTSPYVAKEFVDG